MCGGVCCGGGDVSFYKLLEELYRAIAVFSSPRTDSGLKSLQLSGSTLDLAIQEGAENADIIGDFKDWRDYFHDGCGNNEGATGFNATGDGLEAACVGFVSICGAPVTILAGTMRTNLGLVI